MEADLRVVLIFSDLSFTAKIRSLLKEQRYVVISATNGEIGLKKALNSEAQIVLLDDHLAGLDGYSLCRLLRNDAGTSQASIIMLGSTTEEAYKIAAFDAGADDYLVRPISLEYFLVRIESLLRRRNQLQEVGSENIISGDILLNISSRKAYKGATEIVLLPKTFDLLLFFIQNSGQLLSRDVIYKNVWGERPSEKTRAIDVHVRWLRQLIEDDPNTPTRIIMEYRYGYFFKG